MRFNLTAKMLVIALSGLVSAINGQAPVQAAKAPKLAISKTQHDLGILKRGTLARHSFAFKNEGTADLVIENVAPS